MPRIWRIALFLLMLALMSGWRAHAVAQAPAQNPDVLGALLVEVRGLRAAMEQMASAGPRVQLAMGRLQLQEQRINTLLRQVETIRAALAAKQRDETNMRQQMQEFEEAAGRKADDPNVQRALDEQLRAFKREQPLLAAEIQRLQGDEAAVSQEIATEQGRWSDINRQLDDLERALARKQ